jgi:hypothetical protein
MSGCEEMFEALGLNVNYSAGGADVTFIQAYTDHFVRFMFAGRDKFAAPADEIAGRLERDPVRRPVPVTESALPPG